MSRCSAYLDLQRSACVHTSAPSACVSTVVPSELLSRSADEIHALMRLHCVSQGTARMLKWFTNISLQTA